jgi:hypothetical protein
MPEDFEDFKERLRAERSTRKQRDAAERRISGERLRREIREAFAGRRASRPEPEQETRGERDPSPPPEGNAG